MNCIKTVCKTGRKRVESLPCCFVIASDGGVEAFFSLRPLTRSDGRMATPSSSVSQAPLFSRKDETRRACDDEGAAGSVADIGGIGGGGGGGGGIPGAEMPLEGRGTPEDVDGPERGTESVNLCLK